jgi:hypothetical protein
MGLCHTKRSRAGSSCGDHNSGISNDGVGHETRIDGITQTKGESKPANLFGCGDRGVWQYVQTLEDKVKQLSEKVVNAESNEKREGDKVKRLREDVFCLQGQLQAQSQPQGLHPSPLTPGSASSIPFKTAAYEELTVGLEGAPEKPAGD